MKKKIKNILLFAAVLTFAVGCSSKPNTQSEPEQKKDDVTSENESGNLDSGVKATLTFGTWDPDSVRLYEELDLEGRFQELYPNVSLEIEEYKDDTEYFNAMKIRASAEEMPDLMFMTTAAYSTYVDYLVDLAETDAAKNNILAEGYQVDGKIYGIPEKRQEEYVFYWKDLFEEAGVEVPKTWNEFVEVSKKLQEYYGKDNSDFMAIALGAKDNWCIYPLVENMPGALSGNGQYWNDMTKEDAPFAEGTDIYTAYHKIYDLFRTGVFGKDPLGLGYDQAMSLFLEKKAAMEMDSPIGVTMMRSSGTDLSEMGAFYLPFRESEEDPFYLPMRGDFLLGVTKQSKNPELAVAFLEFYFSENWYPDYIAKLSSGSTMENVDKELDPILESAQDNTPDPDIYTYDGGNQTFQDMVTETRFDCKQLGGEMFTEGFDLDKKLSELNESWAAAREKLDLK